MADETPDPEVILTRHGRSRGKQRVGLNENALMRTAAIARSEGLHAKDTAGSLRRYLDKLMITHKGRVPRIHSGKIFVFGSDNVLVTVLELPHQYRRAAADCLAKRQLS